MRIGIVGAGHAGVAAAQQASSQGANVVLFSNEPVLPYFRPRVVLLAFDRVGPDDITMKPDRWYAERHIDLRLDCPVTGIDVGERAVTANGQRETFDAVIIATGATPAVLPFVNAFPETVFPIWTAETSLAIQRRLEGSKRLVILGGGISGLEAAVYGRDIGLDVTVVEKAPHVMSQQLGPNAAHVLMEQLKNKGVRLRTGRVVTDARKADRQLTLKLDDAAEILCDLALTTVGARQDPSLFAEAGLRTDRGIMVDAYQQTSARHIFAGGDIVQRNGVRTANVVRATEHGRGAASNAIAALTDGRLNEVPDRSMPLSFKHANVEFYAVGPPTGEGLQETILSDDGHIYRSVVLKGRTVCGVQMVGSRDDFQRLAKSLGQSWEPTESQLAGPDAGAPQAH